MGGSPTAAMDGYQQRTLRIGGGGRRHRRSPIARLVIERSGAAKCVATSLGVCAACGVDQDTDERVHEPVAASHRSMSVEGRGP